MLKERLEDSFRFVRKFTPTRILNGFKVLSSYYVTRISGVYVQWGFPMSVSIEPTTSCNLRCPECPSGLRNFTRPTGMLNENVFEKAINELHKTTPYLILYFQGEPYLNQDFFRMVAYAHSKNMYVATSTNAHYLNDENCKKTIESGLSRLIISIDGITQETYESYRIGGKLDKVIEGAKKMVEWKKKLNSSTPHLIFQFLVVKHNEHEIPQLMELAKLVGVDEVKLKTAQVYDYINGNELIPLNEKYARYKRNRLGKYELKNKLENHCWKMWHSCVFTWDGKVVPCCFDKDASHSMGEITQRNFREIWKGINYVNFRKAVLRSRKEIDICSNCSEGTKVWI